MSPTGEPKAMIQRRRRTQQGPTEASSEALANGDSGRDASAAGPTETNQEELQLVGQELVPFSEALVVVEETVVTQQQVVTSSGEVETGTTREAVEPRLSSSRSADRESALRELEDMDRAREFQTPQQPRTMPQSFGPLFTPDQVAHMDRTWVEHAPLTSPGTGQVEVARTTQVPPEPSFDQGFFRQPTQAPPGMGSQVLPAMMQWWGQFMQPPQQPPEDLHWRTQMQREMEQMKVMLHETKVENSRLRHELQWSKELEPRSTYGTPEELKDESTKVREDRRREIAHAQEEMIQQMAKREEDGCPSREGHRQERRQEDGCPSREGHRQGQEEEDGYPSREGYRQERRQEDGYPSREGYRQDQEKDGPRSGGRQEEDGCPSREGHQQDKGGGQSTKKQEMEFMMLMLQSMQELQRKMSEGEGRDGVETVRNGAPDLPMLAEWSSTEGPIAMGDWLTLLEPAVADLSETAEEWWQELTAAVQHWYAHHMTLSPLERTNHRPVAPQHLQQRRWQRLERRVASMLLKSIPESQKEELVAGKSLSAFSIMAHLQILYQPGGLGEKETILRNLESPPEATGLQEAVIQLRRWMRWKSRAKDIGVAEPDPSVLVRGLNRLVKRVLENNRELSFRISLARSTLTLDSAPTQQSVERFSSLLLAEVEQVAHTDRQEKKGATPKPKVNEMKWKGEENEGEKGGKGKGKQGTEGKPYPCKYFLTDEGCRKGRDCTFLHQKDGEKRCFACGSKSHFAGSCPRGSSEAERSDKGQGKGLKALQKSAEKEVRSGASNQGTSPEKGNVEKSDTASSAAGSTNGESEDGMKMLLEEAQRTLKSLHVKGEEKITEADRMSQLQRQLDEIKRAGLKTFRLSRIEKKQESMGLLDSGATHPLRPPKKEENLEQLQKVEVTLAGGQEVQMRISQGGCIVGEDVTEPIVPLGMLTENLKRKLTWSSSGVKLTHPRRGSMDVTIVDGCPMLPADKALELIEEIEEKNEGKVRIARMEVQPERWKKKWLEYIVNEHPAFKDLPPDIKHALVVEPSDSIVPLANQEVMEKARLGRACFLWIQGGLHPDEGSERGGRRSPTST